MLRPGGPEGSSISSSPSVCVPRLTKEGLHVSGSPGGTVMLLGRQQINLMPQSSQEVRMNVLTCVPVPCGIWCDRALQGCGEAMQPQQAKGFCQGCLYQFHFFLLHLQPLAQGL